MRGILLLSSALLCSSAFAGTLNVSISGFNQSKGDVFEYRHPRTSSWVAMTPVYGQVRIPNIPDNVIVVVRVRNGSRNVSIAAVAMWEGNNQWVYLRGSG